MIFKRCLILSCIVFSLSGCYRFKAPDKPDNLIPEDKMVDVLIDAKLIGISNSRNRKIMQDSGINPDTYIYKKYGIDSLQFAQSNEYYSYYIDDYESIYNKIDDSLKTLLKSLKDEQERIKKEAAERRRDSLRQIRDSKLKKDSIQKLKIKIRDSIKKEGLIPPVSDSVDRPR